MIALAVLLPLVGCCDARRADGPPSGTLARTNYPARGVVREMAGDGRSAVVAHEEISGFMPAMTMSFRVKATNELAGLKAGDTITFNLVVTANESWIESVTKSKSGEVGAPVSASSHPTATPARLADVIGDVTFTNELGQPVRWHEFDGQAVGFTFFFTRCPLPEYCPRLMKNFAGASRKLAALSGGPTNWHLLALTFDPEFDKPPVLRAYANAHGADTNRWNFLVTSAENTARIARLFGLNYVKDGGTINHDFRTIIVDALGRVRAGWPIGGDTTDMLVAELIKAAAVTNAAGDKSPGR